MPGTSLAQYISRELVSGPASKLFSHSAALTLGPAGFAQRHIKLGDRKSSTQAFAFVVTAYSAGLIITQIGMLALGIDALSEVGYWTIAFAQILTFIALLTLILKITKRAKLADVLHVLSYPLGAAIFLASLVFTVAALTIYACFWFGLIPPFRLDPARFQNFERTILIEYRNCLGAERALYAMLRDVGMQFEALASPIKYLVFARGVIVAAYLIVFGYLLGKVLQRSAAFTIFAVMFSALITLFGMALSVVAYDNHLYATTPCFERAVRTANAKSAEDQLARDVEALKPLLSRDRTMPIYIEDMKVEGSTVVYYYTVDTMRVDVNLLARTAEISRLERVDAYCRPDVRFFYDLNVIQAHIFRSREGQHLHTHTIGRDNCRR